MTVVKPFSTLKTDAERYRRILKETGGPIILTTEGKGDVIMLSMKEYSRLEFRNEVIEKLDEAQKEIESGGKLFSHVQVMRRLKKRINGKVKV